MLEVTAQTTAQILHENPCSNCSNLHENAPFLHVVNWDCPNGNLDVEYTARGAVSTFRLRLPEVNVGFVDEFNMNVSGNECWSRQSPIALVNDTGEHGNAYVNDEIGHLEA